jgi:aminoglycoside phosphotransferase (APT) family kinase protein
MALPGEVLGWIERQCGGRVVDVEQQVRWRPHHFVTIDRDGHKVRVLARSERDQSIVKHSRMMMHFDIAHEARVLAALQGQGLKIPAFLGFDEEHRIILMEAVPGSNLLAHADHASRAGIMSEYYAQLARLHSLDVDVIRSRVPELDVPETPDDIAFRGKFQFMERDYVEMRPALKPEPLLDLGIWWLHHNVPQGERRVSFVQGDTGPGQFMFEGDHITALIDWELAHVGDPMLDLGVGRMRNMLYPTCSLKEPMTRYQEVSGRPIDWQALRYYTVMSMLLTPLGTSRSIQRVTARATDMIVRFGWDVTLRRGLCDALAEVLELDIEPPELPEADYVWPSMHDYLVEHLEVNCLPLAATPADRFQLDSALAVAKMLRLESRIGTELLADDLDDIAAVLGRRPRDRDEGLARLGRLVDENPEAKLAELVTLFSRVERRREHLWRPLMVAQDSAAFEPITPF